MEVLTKSRMEGMSVEEVLQTVQKAAVLCKVHLQKAWVDMSVLRLAVLVDDNVGDALQFEDYVSNFLVGWYNDKFEYMKEVKTHISDEDCPDIFITVNADFFEAVTTYKGGTLVEYGNNKAS